MRRRIQIRFSPLTMIAGLATGIAIGHLIFHGWPALAHAFNGLWQD
jgi:hypothetical protein